MTSFEYLIPKKMNELKITLYPDMRNELVIHGKMHYLHNEDMKIPQ